MSAGSVVNWFRVASGTVEAMPGQELLVPHTADLPKPERLARSLAGLAEKGEAFESVVSEVTPNSRYRHTRSPPRKD